MRRKYWIIPAGLLTACSCVAILFFMMPSPTPGVTLENSYRIRIGMTENDVESLMGCSGKRRFSHELPDEYQKTWGNGDCGNVVVFDENGKVSRFLVMKNSSTHLVDANESFYEKLCQLLGIKTRERL